ncbi:MAG TPA: alpha/beta hydrolase [Desertimonas sp.]|nr:alpha/beta hydrolase [Desertimonas sp.]
MIRAPRALGLVALLVAGLSVSVGASAAGTTSSDTTEPTDSTEVVETTEVVDTTEAPDTTEVVETTEIVESTEVPATSAPPFEPEPIEWTSIGDGLEEGRLEVPIDYADPDGDTFSLYLVRHLADDPDARIGSLLVNPGGPGFGGTILAESAEFIYSPDLLDNFDIVAWDPRGTGGSEPAIDCIDNYDDYYAGTDITPDDDAERQQIIDVAESFAEQCVERNEAFIEFVGTNNSARDMDTIRRALGEDEISYFGFSYGSELGGTWATLFPETVRAAVLDGARDPNADEVDGSKQQAAGFEATLTTFLAECSANSDCAFHNDGDAEGAFDQLMSKIDDKPLPTQPGRPLLTRGVALQGVAEAMYTDQLWEPLEQALATAAQGDGSGLLALYDSYYQRQSDGTWNDSLEAFQTIHCMDAEERLTVEEEDALSPQFNEIAPRFSPGTSGSYFCTFFPESIDPRVEITGAGAGPIVVCGATGDAATPLESTRAMAESLEDGRLIIIDADQHTCYGTDPCADELIDDYLVNLNAPPPVTEC